MLGQFKKLWNVKDCFPKKWGYVSKFAMDDYKGRLESMSIPLLRVIVSYGGTLFIKNLTSTKKKERNFLKGGSLWFPRSSFFYKNFFRLQITIAMISFDLLPQQNPTVTFQTFSPPLKKLLHNSSSYSNAVLSYHKTCDTEKWLTSNFDVA